MKKHLLLLSVLSLWACSDAALCQDRSDVPGDGNVIRSGLKTFEEAQNGGGNGQVLAKVKIQDGQITAYEESALPAVEEWGGEDGRSSSVLEDPDLIVTSVSVIDATGPGISYEVTAMNKGGEGSGVTFQNAIYLSLDTQIRNTDYMIDDLEITVPSLPAGVSISSGTLNTTVSNVPGGDYYLGVWLDSKNDIPESNENNNTGYDDSPKVTVTSLPAPTGVSASDGTSTDQIDVTWNLVTGATHYKIYRNTVNNTSGATDILGMWVSISHLHDSPFPGVTYYYWVKAAASSSGDNASPFSASDYGWRALLPPTGISASYGTYQDKVRIAWNPAEGATCYDVWRSPDGSFGSFSHISPNMWSSTTFDDLTAFPGASYYYNVNSRFVSEYGSNTSTVGPDDVEGFRRLSKPTGVSASDGTYTDRVRVSWNGVEGASHYRVYRADQAGYNNGFWVILSGWQTDLRYNDTDATPGVIYWYEVEAAVDASGNRPSLPSIANSGIRAQAAVDQPDIGVDHASFDFGAVRIGSYSDRAFVISNTGQADLSVSGTTLSGEHASDFSIPGGGGAFTVTPGSTHPISVRFAPGAEGARNGILSIASNDPDEDPLDVGLTGFGTTDSTGRVTCQAELGAGWNLISVNVAPLEADVDSVMAGVWQEVIILKNNAGEVVIPEYGIDTIGEIDFREGYQLCMSEFDTLSVEGTTVDPGTPIFLFAGWGMIGYLPWVSMDAETALVSIAEKLVFAKDNAGHLYVPELAINTIGEMVPGQGYQVYLEDPDTLCYPSGSNSAKVLADRRTAGSGGAGSEHFVFTAITGENATVVVPVVADPRYSDGTALESGDEIGVFSSAGLCCGAVVWKDSNAAITAWGDDSQTDETDGLVSGDTLHFRIWNRSTGVEYEASAGFQEGHPQVYLTNDFSVLTDLAGGVSTDVNETIWEKVPEGYLLLQNYPNPFNPETAIHYFLPENSYVTLAVYNVAGEKVRTLVDEARPQGWHFIMWDGRDRLGKSVSGGIYICKLQSSSHTQMIRMLLLK